jgi:hypothetical protein
MQMRNKDSLKRTVFLHVTLCHLVEAHQHFGGIYCFHHQGQRINQASKNQVAIFLLLGLFFDSKDGDNILLQNGSELFTELHRVTSQKMVWFIVIAAKITNPTHHSTVSLSMLSNK